MRRIFSLNLVTRLAGALALSGLLVMASVTPGSAWHDGHAHGAGIVGGAIVGGAIGGAVKGGDGVLPGAAIGAIVGGAASSARGHREERYREPAPRQPAGDSELVYNIQVSLNHLGYDAGPNDGVYGERTADAIGAYQYNNGLTVTGEPSWELYEHMENYGG